MIGHEAAGVIEEVGEGVGDFAVGDPVIIVWVPMCGKCRYCAEGRPALCDMAAKAVSTLPDGTPRYTDKDGNPLAHMAGVGVMSGAMQLTRMPRCPSSIERVLVRFSTAAFIAA